MTVSRAAIDKRRVILDAAVRVFARQGFHTCRVADIADAAGVAYGRKPAANARVMPHTGVIRIDAYR